MIIGAHIILYSTDAERDRAFFRDVLGFDNVDAGRGWLIFRLPPSEVAVHPSRSNDVHEFHLMTDDLAAALRMLSERGIGFSEVKEESFGSIVRVELPGGGRIGLYQPKHPTAIGLSAAVSH
jgi:catechol 2,3-dioxygenase-like lactoylglutathione lyase family enzyme